MDVQPKCLAVGPGGYTVVLCIGQVSINMWIISYCCVNNAMYGNT